MTPVPWLAQQEKRVAQSVSARLLAICRKSYSSATSVEQEGEACQLMESENEIERTTENSCSHPCSFTKMILFEDVMPLKGSYCV